MYVDYFVRFDISHGDIQIMALRYVTPSGLVDTSNKLYEDCTVQWHSPHSIKLMDLATEEKYCDCEAESEFVYVMQKELSKDGVKES